MLHPKRASDSSFVANAFKADYLACTVLSSLHVRCNAAATVCTWLGPCRGAFSLQPITLEGVKVGVSVLANSSRATGIASEDVINIERQYLLNIYRPSCRRVVTRGSVFLSLSQSSRIRAALLRVHRPQQGVGLTWHSVMLRFRCSAHVTRPLQDRFRELLLQPT